MLAEGELCWPHRWPHALMELFIVRKTNWLARHFNSAPCTNKIKDLNWVCFSENEDCQTLDTIWDRHAKIFWNSGGRRHLVVGKTPSDYRAAANARAVLRRILRAEEFRAMKVYNARIFAAIVTASLGPTIRKSTKP